MRQRKVKKCAEWLAYCLEIGWDKSQLDGLEKLWMDNHDEFGNFKPQLQQHGVVRPASESAAGGEPFICPCCGSDRTYKTEAYHCNRCAITTEV